MTSAGDLLISLHLTWHEDVLKGEKCQARLADGIGRIIKEESERVVVFVAMSFRDE